MNWHNCFMDSFGKDVPWDFRQNEETKMRWSRELSSRIQRYSDEFMCDAIEWAVKKYERKNPKNNITLPELKDMCFAYLNRNRAGDPVRVDEQTRLRSICIRVKNALQVDKDVFKAWDLLCEAGNNYNCSVIHKWAEEKLGADFTPVLESFRERRAQVMEAMKGSFKNVSEENARAQRAWMDDLAAQDAGNQGMHAEPQEFEEWV